MIRFLLPAAVIVSFAACAHRGPVKLDIGADANAVQAALGKPDRVYKRTTSNGDVEAWGYMPYWVGFGTPTEPIGSRGSLSSDIPLEPMREDEDVRVFFKAGKVVAVESRRSQ